jgi:hypothetical protein
MHRQSLHPAPPSFPYPKADFCLVNQSKLCIIPLILHPSLSSPHHHSKQVSFTPSPLVRCSGSMDILFFFFFFLFLISLLLFLSKRRFGFRIQKKKKKKESRQKKKEMHPDLLNDLLIPPFPTYSMTKCIVPKPK